MRHEADALENELRRVREELAREREGARLLRRALEQAAIYFQVPGGDTEVDAVWLEIVRAIRSDAGRDAELRDPVEFWEREEAPSSRNGIVT